MKRRDIHSPKRFKPADYCAVGYLDNRPPPPPFIWPGCDTQAVLRAWQDERDAWQAGIFSVFPGWRTGGEDHQSIYRCNHCGAHIRWVVVVEHAPTGKLLAFGEICAAERIGIPIDEFKMRALQSKAAKTAKARKREARRLKLALEMEAKAAAALVEFTAEHPSIVKAFRGYEGKNSFLRDMREKLSAWGTLSGKQLAASEKALEREAAEANGPPEILPPAGRHEIEGEVISAKWRETDYGDALKLTVNVVNCKSRYRVWGTAPRALIDQMMELCDKHGYDGLGAGDHLKGCRVRFTATVDPQETGFGFYSRPSKAALMAHDIDTSRDIYGETIGEGGMS